jgi:hypothetical protein
MTLRCPLRPCDGFSYLKQRADETAVPRHPAEYRRAASSRLSFAHAVGETPLRTHVLR